MKTDLSKSEYALLTFLLFVFWHIPCSIYAAWVLKMVWGWFIVPLGVMPLTVAHAYALGLLIVWLTKSVEYNSTQRPLDTVIGNAVMAFARPTWVLVFGWICKAVMVM